jgi:hypothetical protein
MAYETLSEKILNGKPINWLYWAGLTNITPNQAAKLANRIDPIKWPNNKCHLGDIPEDIQILIRSLEQQLENQQSKFTLQELTQHLGNDSPEGMLEQVSTQTNLIINNLLAKKERDLTKWMRETWVKEGKLGGSGFFNKLKNYVNKDESPIREHFTTGKNGAGITWNTGNTRNSMTKKAIQNKVSKFKSES